MDFSKLSDDDLSAIADGDMSKVSDKGLDYIVKQDKFEKELQAVKQDTGLSGSFKAGKERLKGDVAAVLGRTGIMDTDAAEQYKAQKEQLAEKMFKPTTDSWSESPFMKFKETLGGSLPYTVAPLAAGVAAAALPAIGVAAPVAAGIGAAGAGLASLGQFTGSNLSRQMQENPEMKLAETNLSSAAIAAIPQAALDVVSLRMIPGIGKIFGAAGKEITPAMAKQIAEQGMLKTAGSYALSGTKLSGVEGATEAGQQVLERLQAGLNITDEQARSEYFDSFLGGAVLGGALSVPGTAIERSQTIRKGAEMEKEEQQKAIQERQKAQQEAALAEQEQIGKTKEALGVSKMLALPAPATIHEAPVGIDPLLNPLGNFRSTDLSPKEVAEVNRRRVEAGLPRIGRTFSIEDLSNVFTPDEAKDQAGVLNRLIASRTGYQAGQDFNSKTVEFGAQKRGIDTGTQGFKDFLKRTTGLDDLRDMSPVQRLAVVQALQKVQPGEETQILQSGISNAKTFTEDQYNAVVNGLTKEFKEVGNVPNGRESVLKHIEKYSGLLNARDQKRMLDRLVKDDVLDHDMETREVNGVKRVVELFKPAQELPGLPGGMDVRAETFKQGDMPAAYEIKAGAQVIDTVDNEEEANKNLEAHIQNRDAQVAALGRKIAKLEAGMAQRANDLVQMKSLGQGDSLEFLKKEGNTFGQDVQDRQEIQSLREQQQSFLAPVRMSPVGTKPITSEGFTYYENGKAIARFDSEEKADQFGISRLDDKTLQRIIDAAPQQTQIGKVKRYSDLAQKELNERQSIEPERGIAVTTTKGLKGAKERLESLGIYSQEAHDNLEKLRQSLLPALKRFGLEKVALRILNSIENGTADGYYIQQVMAIALDSKNPMGTLRHESIHALKELGAFTAQEWKVLENKAKSEWVQKYIKDTKLYDAYKEKYQAENGNLIGFEPYIQEEAIAEAFKHFKVGNLQPGMVGNIWVRLNKMFEALRNAFNKLGFQTTEDIFTKIEEGKMQAAEAKQGETGKYDLTKRIDMNFKQVTERIPELKDAMVKLEANEITAKDYDKLVNKYKPVMPYDFVPKPATKEEAIGAIEDKETYGTPSATLEDGHPVGLRLDIPAYSRYGVWVPTVHEQASGFGAGKKIGHESVAAVTNATFGMSEKAAASIAGGKPKGTIATIKGNWKNISEKNAVAQAEKALNSPEWTQVGMDPERHSYFYDRTTTEPIVSADEVIQIGPLVLAKNPVYAPKAQFKYSLRKTSSLENVFEFARDNDFKRNRDLKVAIQNQVLAAAEKEGIDLASTEDETTSHLIKAGVDDAIYALKTNANAVGWYDKTVAKALNIISLMHPEIKTDPDAKFAFTWALAVTSNGMKVDKNFELAEQAYNIYKKTGKMPTNVKAGETQQAINKSLELFNSMIDKYGIDNMRKFMATEFTVKQIESLTNLKVGGEFADTRVLGASILGPKIGNGFFSNLNGIFDQLTMDRWLMRTWGRWTGSLIEDNARLIDNKRGEMERLIKGLLRPANKATRERFERITGKTITEADLASNDAVDALAAAVNKSSQKPLNRTFFNKSDIGRTMRKTSNSLVGYIDAQKEAPSGPAERNYIREVFSGILDSVRKRGYPNMTMSDLQALLWYPERRLYDVAKESNVSEGYTDDEAPDYANAAAKLARLNGIPDSEIKAVVTKTEKEYENRAATIQRDAGRNANQVGSEGRDVGFAGKERSHFITRGIIRSYRERNEASPNAYKGTSGKDGGGFRVLGQKAIAEFKPVARFKNALSNADVTAPTFYELDSNGAALFQDSISDAKDNTAFGAAVYVYPEADYANMRMFLTSDGKAGFALKGDDIVSVFSQKPHVGGVNGVMQLAVQEGGRRLDAFDTVLPDLYYNNGFKTVARLGWNEEYKPEGWNKETFRDFGNGNPDVVFMVYDPEYNQPPTNTDGVKVNEYDEGTAEQAKSIPAGAKASFRRFDESTERPSAIGSGIVLGTKQADSISLEGIHYSNAKQTTLNGNQYGKGIKGAEAARIAQSNDPRIKNRVYFYIENAKTGEMQPKESGLGNYVHKQKFDNILAPSKKMTELWQSSNKNYNMFESSVIDAGYDGYAVPDMGMMVILNHDTPINYEGTVQELADKGVKYSLRSQIDPTIQGRISATTTVRKEAGYVERLMDAISPTAMTRIRQGLINKYESIEQLSRFRGEKMGAEQLLAENSAIAAALQSDRAAGIAASSFRDGVPVFDKGYTYVSNMDNKVKGLIPVLEPLMKYKDPYVFQAFQYYAGTRRGRRLDAEGREKTFTKEDIDAGKQLEAQFPEFATVFDEYQKYNQGLVKYMMDTGVISAEEAKIWTQNWDYIPFYRQLEGEKTAGPKVFSPIAGVAKPKKLKGSEAPLDDFMETIVRNARAAIEAGMKNEAARRVIRDVTDFGLGERLPSAQSGSDVVSVKENGITVYYRVADPLLVESLKGLNLPQLPFMDFLSAPANLLRNFVTKDPGFILANLGRDSMQAWITSGTDISHWLTRLNSLGVSC